MIGLEMFANVKSETTAIEIELNVRFLIRARLEWWSQSPATHPLPAKKL
jgi:hypothetical protein